MSVQLILTSPELGAVNLNQVVKFNVEFIQPSVVLAPVAGGTIPKSFGSTVAPVLLKI